MKLFIIPSWYPSASHPSTGIFFKEQSELLARYMPNYSVGISLWGSHETRLWLKASSPLTSLIQFSSKPPIKPHEVQLQPNCIEFFTPAYTWTRKIFKGNIDGIIEANEANFKRYTAHFGKPDLIHAHVAYPGGYIARALSIKYHVPYMITEHMSPFPMASFKSDFHRYLLPPLRDADLVLAVSKALQLRLKEFGVEAKKISNFIDDEFFQPVRVNSNVFTFVVVARLEKQKGIEHLLMAAKHQLLDGLDFDIRIIGSGSLKGSLKRKAEHYGLSNVWWIGEGDREVVKVELQKADTFILPSIHENQPVAILEALACGLPVITTDWAGAEEMVSKETGLIVEKANPAALAQAMRKVLTERRFDRKEIRLAFDEKYGTNATTRRLENYYKSLLD